MRSPIVWYGGKGNLTSKLLPLLPEHAIYVEAFGGGASLLFAKAPSPIEVYNDLDEGLVGFYRVLRDPEQFARFRALVELTPYARSEWYGARSAWAQCLDPVERAHRWFVVARGSFSGAFGRSWTHCVTMSRRGMSGAVSRWLSTIDALPEIHERLRQVQIEGKPWAEILAQYDTPTTFFYLDPPYLPATRTERDVYAHELTLEDHVELVRQVQLLQGKVLLSGYQHPLYAPLDERWRRIDFPTSSYATGRTRFTGAQGAGSATARHARTESVWLNYAVGDSFAPLLPAQKRAGNRTIPDHGGHPGCDPALSASPSER